MSTYGSDVCYHVLCTQEGGLNGFMHSFLAEVMAICRAHVAALGGNALVAFQLTECIIEDNVHKNQVNTVSAEIPASHQTGVWSVALNLFSQDKITLALTSLSDCYVFY